MRCITIVLAMALLIVPFFSATAMAQIELSEVGEELAQNVRDALGQIDMASMAPALLAGMMNCLFQSVNILLGALYSIVSIPLEACLAPHRVRVHFCRDCMTAIPCLGLCIACSQECMQLPLSILQTPVQLLRLWINFFRDMCQQTIPMLSGMNQ